MSQIRELRDGILSVQRQCSTLKSIVLNALLVCNATLNTIQSEFELVLDAFRSTNKAVRTTTPPSYFATAPIIEANRKSQAEFEAFFRTVEQLEDLATKLGEDHSEELGVEEAKRRLLATDKSNAPPYIELSEAKGYTFELGSSELSHKFENQISTSIVDRIEEAIKQHKINLIEVIGHTDGKPVSARDRAGSSIDTGLENFVAKSSAIAISSNADLGLLRAIEVVKFLIELHREGRLQGIDPETGFRAYSAAQAILPDGEFSNGDRSEDSSRRRIEIRLTRLGTKVQ
ncbi:MAG: hypothetical protein ACRESZ_11115 [Methylococcales bacterium]